MDESQAMSSTSGTSTKDVRRFTTKSTTEPCHSTSCAASQLQGKWRVPILCVLRAGPVRLGELSRLLPEASKKMLMAELKRLVLTGLVVRRDLTGNKNIRHVEYCLAQPIEAATARLLQQLEEWNQVAQAMANSSKPEHVR